MTQSAPAVDLLRRSFDLFLAKDMRAGLICARPMSLRNSRSPLTDHPAGSRGAQHCTSICGAILT